MAKGKIDPDTRAIAVDIQLASGDRLPTGALPVGIVPVTKTLFIDLLAPEFNLVPTIAEKIEGLSWGPDLSGDDLYPRGRRSTAVRQP